MDAEKRVTMLREASQVKRYHTLPHIGHNTDGQHSFDMVMLLLVLKPDASRNLIIACLGHDMGERWWGDMPAPAKWSDPAIGAALDKGEERCRIALGVEMPLTADERNWLKALDMTECLLWCKDQLALGNTNVEQIIRLLAAMLTSLPVPQPILDFVIKHKWERTSDKPL